MPFFNFNPSEQQDSDEIGKVREVDTLRIIVHANSSSDFAKVRVGHLVAISSGGAVEEWLIGIIDKLIKIPFLREQNDSASYSPNEGVNNTIHLTSVGTVCVKEEKTNFTRSLAQIPEIDTPCYVLRNQQLQNFMKLLSAESETEHSLQIGFYALDKEANAYIDGNKFFQRHASLLGSTGSGKSWLVSSILEKANMLKSSNLIVFDLHGEYRELKYAKHFRIPSPEDLEKKDEALLFLPYWLLNTEELQSMFIDRTEFNAHNQVTKFKDIVTEEKKKTLEKLDKKDLLKAFTLDSPIPFEIDNVINELNRLNDERIPADRGKDKKGPYNDQFSRFLERLRNRINDRRYGFMFKVPETERTYESMANMMKRLMSCSEENCKIKVIDLSDAPSDILPIIIGLIARIIYQVQFWTNSAERTPMALVCDEAHLYLPKKEGLNPIEQRAVEAFEKIAKEGRKYGVSLLIVSQRPSDVSSTILSQCSNVIALRLTNGEDQSTVKRLMPESFRGLMETLSILDIGEALVIGDSVLLPSRIKIDEPKEKPLSATIDFWEEWKEQKQDRDFEKAVENIRKQNRS